jgi:hypothetical protein
VTDTQTQTLPVAIPIPPWLFDHCFEGFAILPAVEMLQHLARAVQSRITGATITSLKHASFYRFIRIDPDVATINVLCTLTVTNNGDIQAQLATDAKVGSAGVTRIKEHASVFFSQSRTPAAEIPTDALAALYRPGFDISAQQLYDELVPFGPAFQSIQGKVVLTESMAVARVRALDNPGAEGPLGSPFPFDGSLHAACAWAQRYCGIVAFPVGFDERVIVQPIVPGEEVVCTIMPVSVHKGIIRFDIRLHDEAGRLREMVKGMAMKDVSGGRRKPPDWVSSKAPVSLVRDNSNHVFRG